MKRGFSLVETLIALALIATALIGFIALVSLNIRTAKATKQRQVAAKIAQEGMEMIVNKKANNILCLESETCPGSMRNWKHNLVGTFMVDSNDLEDLLPGRKFKDYKDNPLCLTSSGKYGYCPGNRGMEGNFTREVQVKEFSPCANERLQVEVFVTWKSGLTSENLHISEIIFGDSEEACS